MTDNAQKFLFSPEYMTGSYAMPPYAKVDFGQAMLYQQGGPFDYLPTTSGMHSGALLASNIGSPPLPVQAPMQPPPPTSVPHPDTPVSSCSSPAPHPPAPAQSSSSSTASSASSARFPTNGAPPPCSPTSASTTSASPSPSLIHHASLSDTLSRASTLPDAFYPEFLQYSRESYEQSTGANRKKRRLESPMPMMSMPVSMAFSPVTIADPLSGDEQASLSMTTNASNTELRRQIHIQSEQKRRAQIKDGFEELRNELPSCLNKKMSKVALLHRTVQHIQHLKNTQMTVLAELERLASENEQLRKFQEGVLQRQALEKMYQINNTM